MSGKVAQEVAVNQVFPRGISSDLPLRRKIALLMLGIESHMGCYPHFEKNIVEFVEYRSWLGSARELHNNCRQHLLANSKYSSYRFFYVHPMIDAFWNAQSVLTESFTDEWVGNAENFDLHIDWLAWLIERMTCTWSANQYWASWSPRRDILNWTADLSTAITATSRLVRDHKCLPLPMGGNLHVREGGSVAVKQPVMKPYRIHMLSLDRKGSIVFSHLQ